MADIVALAQVFYDSAVSDSSRQATLRKHLSDLCDAIAAGTTTGSIVTAGKNGGNYTTRIDTSTTDRLFALKEAVNGLNTGCRPSRSYYARF